MNAIDNYRAIKRLAEICEEEAVSRGLEICVTVFDEHGNIVLTHRMPGSGLIAISMAERKAWTSIALLLDSGALKPLIQPGGALYSIPTFEALVAFGGGSWFEFPDGSRFGIGISGGPNEHVDMELVAAARGRFTEVAWPSAEAE